MKTILCFQYDLFFSFQHDAQIYCYCVSRICEADYGMTLEVGHRPSCSIVGKNCVTVHFQGTHVSICDSIISFSLGATTRILDLIKTLSDQYNADELQHMVIEIEAVNWNRTPTTNILRPKG